MAVVADLLERAGWTAGQVFLTVLLTTSAAPAGVIDLPWQLSLVMAAGGAVGSILTSLLMYLTPLTKLGFWADLALRLGKTFVAALAGFFTAGVVNVLTFNWGGAFDLAAVATLTALAKGLLARQTTPSATEPANPSTLPTATYQRAVAA